jgi:2TM domain
MDNYINVGESNNNAQDNFNKEEAFLRAKKKFDKLKGFYWHLASYVVVNMFLIIMVTTHLDENESFWQFNTFATAIFWGIGLAFHAMGVFGPDLIFGKDWENRKINEYMDKDKRHWE